MLFNSLQFAVFFLCVLALHRAAPPARRNGLLLGASLFFYFCWIPAYLVLLIAEASINYVLLRRMAASRRPGVWLTASVVTSLGVLAAFKYGVFFALDVAPLLGLSLPVPDLILPLGISFYTFQMIALATDTYRGRIEAVAHYRDYLLFVVFFPQLVAGPIVRGSELLPQIRQGGETNRERSRRGAWLLGAGAFKKIVLGDFLLGPFVDFAFDNPAGAAAPIRLLGLYSFAFQIYFDFSGYTDMARGIALLLGFELPRNFLEPYLSRNPSEFWRRWHITLSRWLRDYLYIPLGGNREGQARLFANLLITMTLGGLWHGAGWNFVIWGMLHGVLLVGHRLIVGPPSSLPAREAAPRDALRVLALFHSVGLLWVFFRCATPHDAMDYLGTLFTGDYTTGWPIAQVLIVMLCAGLQVLERFARKRGPALRARLETRPGGAIEGAVFGVILALAFWLGGAGEAFIYFQF